MIEDGTQQTLAAWRQLENSKEQLRLPDLTVVSFRDFAEGAARQSLSRDQRISILEQAEKLLANFYVHNPFKRRKGLLDPATEIPRIAAMVDDLEESLFHELVLNLFIQQEDAHTLYGLPAPYRNSLAFLPFQLRSFEDAEGNPRFVVAKQMPGFEHSDFRSGVEVVEWSGTGILVAVQESAQGEVGGNMSAFLANGLNRMTLRPLTHAFPPRRTQEVIGYLDAAGELRSISVPWAVGTGLTPMAVFGGNKSSTADDLVQAAMGGMIVWNPDKYLRCRHAPVEEPVDSKLPEIFDFQYAGGRTKGLVSALRPEAKFGYVRVHNFDVHTDGLTRESEICAEFGRILGLMMEHAADGLILDIRGNPGGNVRAAEGMLQMLTPNEIVPARFHWPRNPALDAVLRKLKSLKADFATLNAADADHAVQLGADFADWLADLEGATDGLPEFLSSGKPITEDNFANQFGQIYQGPVVLLVDAFTYSAADIFAGGFQDHGIGTILGTDASTGGGGATRWRYEQLLPHVAGDAAVPLEPLPPGVTMTVAVQRSARVLGFAGQPIEGVGVQADVVHRRTKRDVLEGNPDLFARACELLAASPAHRLVIVEAVLTGDTITARTEGKGIASLAAKVNGLDVAIVEENGSLRLDVSALGSARELRLALYGMDGDGRRVVAAKMTLRRVAQA